MNAARRLRRAQQPRSMLDYFRQFLTPRVWKQARQMVPPRRAAPRWDLQPVVVVLMLMTWAAGDSQAEKFETARGFYVGCYAARKRPGQTLAGFQKALRRIPLRQLRALAAGVRQEIRRRYAERLLVAGFEPIGCDGSRIECPRTSQLERRLRQAGNRDAAPTVWVTGCVHLATGLLWSWQLGPGTAAEQDHLRGLLGTLSSQALIVCDAAYMGYELAWAIVGSNRSFLFRMSSRVHLYTAAHVALADWTEGPVWYWPKSAQEQGLAPLACRLIRLPAHGAIQHDVWLLTDVLDPGRLSVATAAQFYRWRWRNEGVFRIYKRTIKKLKLSSRTLGLVHREAELSLLATQLLLAHADLALRSAQAPAGTVVISPRAVLLAIRREMKCLGKRRVRSYRDRLRSCRASARQQTTPKATRQWPRRKPHEPPKPPKLHTLSEDQKVLLEHHIRAA